MSFECNAVIVIGNKKWTINDNLVKPAIFVHSVGFSAMPDKRKRKKHHLDAQNEIVSIRKICCIAIESKRVEEKRKMCRLNGNGNSFHTEFEFVELWNQVSYWKCFNSCRKTILAFPFHSNVLVFFASLNANFKFNTVKCILFGSFTFLGPCAAMHKRRSTLCGYWNAEVRWASK